MKIKLSIEYNGTKFFGWQKQNGLITAQETIENAVSKVFNEKEKIELFGAGRTDTGVHAECQIAHFCIENEFLSNRWKNDIKKLPLAINFYLINSGTYITKAEIATDDFHARFSAKMRHYKYLIYNRAIDSILLKNRVWHISKKLDEIKMNESAHYLLGTHNFNSFRSAHCGASNPIKTISNIKVYRDNDFIIIEISAKSFLHNQVRIITGTIKQIGEYKFQPEYIKHLLEIQDRTKAGETAPPYGLYLVNVEY